MAIYTATLTLVNAATVTKTFSATVSDLPTAKETIAQYCKNGGMYADNGNFYPTSAIFSVGLAAS